MFHIFAFYLLHNLRNKLHIGLQHFGLPSEDAGCHVSTRATRIFGLLFTYTLVGFSSKNLTTLLARAASSHYWQLFTAPEETEIARHNAAHHKITPRLVYTQRQRESYLTSAAAAAAVTSSNIHRTLTTIAYFLALRDGRAGVRCLGYQSFNARLFWRCFFYRQRRDNSTGCSKTVGCYQIINKSRIPVKVSENADT